jgi:hypothetical protein
MLLLSAAWMFQLIALPDLSSPLAAMASSFRDELLDVPASGSLVAMAT